MRIKEHICKNYKDQYYIEFTASNENKSFIFNLKTFGEINDFIIPAAPIRSKNEYILDCDIKPTTLEFLYQNQSTYDDLNEVRTKYGYRLLTWDYKPICYISRTLKIYIDFDTDDLVFDFANFKEERYSLLDMVLCTERETNILKKINTDPNRIYLTDLLDLQPPLGRKFFLPHYVLNAINEINKLTGTICHKEYMF